MMPSSSNNTHFQFYSRDSTSARTLSNVKTETAYDKEKSSAFQNTPSIRDRVREWCSWLKTAVIVGIIVAVALVVTVIVVPIYVVRLLASQTTTTTMTTTTVYLPIQCSNYTLDTDASRLTTFSATTSACDNTIFSTPLWVRFSGGGATQLATNPPQPYHCGTLGVGWLASPLPSTAGATAMGLVCFVWSNNACSLQIWVSMTNCNGFYVFLLVATPCTYRYCTQ